jgi:outer membrane receptor protein involved in Fe transport
MWLLATTLLPLSAQTKGAETSKNKITVQGRAVSKSDGKGIPYATVTIQGDSSEVVLRFAADGDGKFSGSLSRKGRFKLLLTATGFQEYNTPIDLQNTNLDLGTLTLEEGVAMKTVVVTGVKPLVRVDPDKITYSIESDPDAKTSNGLEILRKVPLLNVDAEENVTLNGQSNYKVLVNGKSSSLMSKNFKDVIKSLPANSIKDIEVITNPSTKYESEGVGGIINIITHKKTLNGYNGSVNLGADQWGGLNGGMYLSSRVGKLGFSGRYSISQSKRPGSESNQYGINENSDSKRFTDGHSEGKSRGYNQNISGELSYDIDTFNLISASFWGYGGNSSNNSRSVNTSYDTQHLPTEFYSVLNNGKSSYNSFSGNIDYQRSFAKPDKSLTASYNFDLSPDNSSYQSHMDSTFHYTPYKQRSESKDLSQEHTLQLDYYDPLSEHHQLECGVKFIYRSDDGDSKQWRNDTLRQDFSNRLTYNQSILGMYGGYVFKLSKMTTKGGFRLERTWNRGKSISSVSTPFSNELFNIVPYISLNYQLKPSQNIRLSYTQRLQRPSIYYLNPYVDNSNPKYIRHGNTGLKSEVSHSFELSYNYFNNNFSFNSSLSASITNNSIESLTTMDTAGVSTTTYANIGLDQRYNFNNYLSYRIGTRFNIYLGGTASYSRFAAHNGMNLSNEGTNFQGYGGGRLSLWKNASLNANGGFMSSYVYLQGSQPGYSYSSIGFSQYLIQRKMSLNLSVSDPFLYRRYTEGTRKGPGFTSRYESWSYSRSIRLSVSYNFGKMDTSVKKARRGISNDDVKSSS